MVNINKLEEYLKNNLREKRFNHVLRVRDMAKALAKHYGMDEDKAEIAALGHDIAKNMDIDELKRIINENNIILTEDEEKTPELWHAMVAPIICRSVFKIEDEEVLGAMRWHTTGKANMTSLEKLIYIADMIELGRNFPGVEEIRKYAFEDLDKGVLHGLTHSIKYLLDRNLLVNVNSIEARNYLIMENK